MAAGNRSPLGFSVIALFHLAVLGVGVAVQNSYEKSASLGLILLGVFLVLGAVVGYLYRQFLFDVFRSFKSAGVLITLLVVSCILGTVLIQDLDLRRAGVFTRGDENLKDGELPPFDNDTQITRFALAEAHGLLSIFPNEERTRLLAEKVRLSQVEQKRVELRKKAFGEKAAMALHDGLLSSKEKGVKDLTTSNYARKHFSAFVGFFHVVDTLRLFDIFEAWWFYLLLALIAINVMVGTWVRAPWKPRDWGIAITHAGVLIILAGALLDVLKAKEGYINYVEGRPETEISGKIYDQKTQTYTHLPFRVRLDRFATEYFHELQVQRFDWSMRHDGSPWSEGQRHGSPFFAFNHYAIREGVPRVFEDGDVRVTIKNYKPRVFVRSTIKEAEGKGLNPAIRVAVYNRPEGGHNLLPGANVDPWLFARDRERQVIDVMDYVFEYHWAQNEVEFNRLTAKAPLPDNGSLILRSKGSEIRVPVRLGREREVTLGDRSLKLHFFRIRSALADSKDVNLDNRLQRSEEPILYLRVDGRDIRVPRDDKEFMSDFAILPGVDLRFDWPDPSDHGVTDIYRVVGGQDEGLVLVQAGEGDQPVVKRLGREPVALEGGLSKFWFGIEQSVRSAARVREVLEVSDEEFLSEGGTARDQL
ncbi:MAG: cytochrome c biogenesis protein ResB, partial [Planctomycetota bacterium]